jgi:hypothetical protein
MKNCQIILLVLTIFSLFGIKNNDLTAQRVYTNESVLAKGSWYKLCTKNEGIYKVDVAFLNQLGISTNNLISSSIQLFGNGGNMLSENNSINPLDDLSENAIEMFDGGDGVFNGNDFFLFYGQSPDKWIKDSINQKFIHQKNIYADSVIYFLKIGNNGKRISTNNTILTPNKFVTTFNERYFHENDLINFLNSGKEWFGEEFSSLPGNSLARSFSIGLSELDITQPVQLTTNFSCRSIGASSNFSVSVNNQLVQNINTGTVSGNFLDAYVTNNVQNSFFNVGNNLLNLTINFSPSSISSQGWLNWFELHARKNLSIGSLNQLFFRDWQSVGVGNNARYTINNCTSTTSVWDITNSLIPEKISTIFSNGQLSFIRESNRLREFVIFNNSGYLIPSLIGKIDNQNLHNSQPTDYLIIAPPLFLSEAKRLALFHQQQYQYKVTVASTTDIFNEFASGIADPSALRDFVKMYFDKSAGDPTKNPKYLLLFGAASFDYKNRLKNNTNFVPCYESANSIDPLLSYTSDDFFALLNDADDINLSSPPSQLDIAVGRIPVSTTDEAKNAVDKIINYHSKASLGQWRNNTIFVADDKDANTHLNDAEFVSNNANTTNNLFNQSKIYLDAYPLVSGNGGGRYPAVNNAIVNQIFNGALFFNYNGHGGYNRLADEAILSQNEANQFNNANKLPLLITATCDFVPYDDPTKTALGTSLLVAGKTGAIGLVTTTRVVFAFSNRIINDNFLKIILKKDNSKGYLTLGEAVKKAKNDTYQNYSDVVNNRKFTLIGDPAIQLAFPKINVQITSINNHPINGNDTLKPLTKYTFSGRILDLGGTLQNNFNGTVYPTLFDKVQSIKTLGNDPQSPIVQFNQQTNTIYRGKATVQNGLFDFSFVVPKDINNQVGNGRLSTYAENGNTDANGVTNSFLIGGFGNSVISDTRGPEIKAFLNDEKFVNGGLVNESPILIVQLLDSSGINASGTGIGHDITAIIDGDEKNIIVLNNFYESSLDNYQKGSIHYQLNSLSEGVHFIKIKAWDVANNSNEFIIEFFVAKTQQLKINHVLNYPNPFTTSTNFWFEHNQPFTNLNVLINIYTISGKLVHQIQRIINGEGNRVNDIFWDGKDRFNQKLARGVYFYRIIVSNSIGQKVETTQKIYLL